MSNVKIETLTPVHVGSGNLLYNNTDFVTEKIGEDSYLIVISEEKIWKLLGKQHLENWLEAIAQRKNLKDFLNTHSSNLKPEDYAKRQILLFSKVNSNDTLKEAIHNGMGLPYIPGSSIKGAIRTAVLASLADSVPNKENLLRGNNGRVSATEIEKKLFGNDPNSDVFRFIQVGDAYFEEESEIATRLVNLNIRSINDLTDRSKPQLVEAIGSSAESFLQLKIAKQYYDFVKQKSRFMDRYNVGNLPINSIYDLLRLINVHTQKLVEEEIEDWENICNDKTGGDDYLDEMKKIVTHINDCKEGKSCVLRIGHASGWRFITGAWTESLGNFKNVVVPASRPNNRNYEKYDFPKTRRLDEDSYILGFVKLTLKE
jgi:CRISPR type III-A-associated RAMP protein Csm5